MYESFFFKSLGFSQKTFYEFHTIRLLTFNVTSKSLGSTWRLEFNRTAVVGL